MTETKPLAQVPEIDLATLRVDIDRIDAEVHRLLMERGEIIGRLIDVKARQGGGSAFRPGREADMMRRLVQRHRGLLPLDTIESIWRIIISTFTYVQANYRVHVDISGGDAPMRDTARFHFGFTVPYTPHASPDGVIEAVAKSDGDLGILRMDAGMAAGAWWRRLSDPQAPKIIARLPFIDRPDHPAGLPVFVISKPLAEAAANEVIIYSAFVDRWRKSLKEKIEAEGGEILGNVGTDNGLSVLISAPGHIPTESLNKIFASSGISNVKIQSIGSHAARYQVRSNTAHSDDRI